MEGAKQICEKPALTKKTISNEKAAISAGTNKIGCF
jgi:hypothetical protein